MIPLMVPNLNGKEKEYLDYCIDSTYVSSVGEFVDRLEDAIAKIAGAEYGVAVSSGTTGLHLALVGYGVCRDDLVIIPSFTFIATANAVSHCGAMPWLMDISSDSWTIDVNQLEKELEEKTTRRGNDLIHKESGRRVAAIMPVYTLGNVPDMEKLMQLAERYKLPVIADAAAAIGAEYKGRNIGGLADCTIFSFNGNKTVTCGGGGAIVGNDKQMLNKLKHLSTTARVNTEYDFDMIGYNYRMTNIQAAVGCAQLERVNEFVEKKRYIRHIYREKLREVVGISFFPEPADNKSSCWLSGIVIENGNQEKLRNICVQLREKGIEARTFWKPIHLQKPYEGVLRADSLENTDMIWNKILTLPCSTIITEVEIETVVNAVKEILQI